MFIIYSIISFLFSPNIIKPLNNNNIRCKIYCDSDLEKSLTPPSGGQLKLLTHLNVENWAYNWIIMISSNETPFYDEHFYINLFTMRGVANMFTNSNFFYIGFFPNGKTCNNGPKYIGLFELNHSKKIMNTKIIIENPHYIEEDSSMLSFKESMILLTNSSNVLFSYNELNSPGQLRYYYSWFYL